MPRARLAPGADKPWHRRGESGELSGGLEAACAAALLRRGGAAASGGGLS